MLHVLQNIARSRVSSTPIVSFMHLTHVDRSFSGCLYDFPKQYHGILKEFMGMSKRKRRRAIGKALRKAAKLLAELPVPSTEKEIKKAKTLYLWLMCLESVEEAIETLKYDGQEGKYNRATDIEGHMQEVSAGKRDEVGLRRIHPRLDVPVWCSVRGYLL